MSFHICFFASESIMKLVLAQLNYKVGDIEGNTSKIIAAINKAKQKGADLIIFSELAVCGYPPLDLLEMPVFAQKCEEAVQAITKACEGIAAIVGSPIINYDKGKKVFNGAYFIENREIKNRYHKVLLPTYDIFDEARYFEAGKNLELISFKGYKIALTICEDIWSVDENTPYHENPLEELTKHHPDIMINIAASPFHVGHVEKRQEVIEANAKKYQLPLIYVNQVGVNTDIVFDGGSKAINEKGEVLCQASYFKEELVFLEFLGQDFSLRDTSLEMTKKEKRIPPKVESIYKALVLGIKDFFQKSGFKTAVLGLSGGIDSAVILALACEALGIENVHSILMPSTFSSGHSVSDSEQMCKGLGCSYDIIPIQSAFDEFTRLLKPIFNDKPFDHTEENLQARSRGILLMAYSNKKGNILLNTSNKSELAVGYGTLYGDMCGGLSPLGDLYKTQVYQLASYINSKKEIIPVNIITKPPSAELRPDQKDSDSLPDYEILDKILYCFIEEQLSVNEIIKQGFNKELVEKTISLVVNSEYKRYQAPPVIRVSSKAFGIGRRIPLVGKKFF